MEERPYTGAPVLEALALPRMGVVAITGAGGKTTLAGRLAAEAAAAAMRVVVTSTTRFTLPRIGGARLVVADARAELWKQVTQALREAPAVIAATGALDRARFAAVPPTWLDDPAGLPADLVLVNADGARMRPLKAPGDHEPVIPASAGAVVAVAGLDVIGRPLDGRWVHRPEVLARVAGVEPGAIIDEDAVCRLLASPGGGRKGVGEGMLYRVALTKAESPGSAAAGRRIAAALVSAGVERVAVLALGAADPVVAVAGGRA